MALQLSASSGVAFLVSYGIVCEIIAKVNSSPQTTELNAEKRAPTLMKWVHIGMVESALVVGVAYTIDKKYRYPILAGGILGMIITEAEYIHAKSCGLANAGEPTEEWERVQGQEGGLVIG